MHRLAAYPQHHAGYAVGVEMPSSSIEDSSSLKGVAAMARTCAPRLVDGYGILSHLRRHVALAPTVAASSEMTLAGVPARPQRGRGQA